MNYDIKDIKLSSEGKKRIEWADKDMPVLREIRVDFQKTKPFKGMNISACLHVTAETANLARTLKAGGANVVLVASNPLSTQDDVAASLVKDYKIEVLAIKGENRETYYKHLRQALKHAPIITLDDGADLISLLHSDFSHLAKDIKGSMEETTTGVIRLKSLQESGNLNLPVIAVNDAKTKNLFDNRYGTGQSTLDGIIRATDMLIAGKTIVVAGYGWCGRGFATRARGMGAKVIVTEVDEIKALEASMDGFVVMPMEEAASIGDLFCTLTGDLHVVDTKHFKKMKDGAIVCNSGHFDVEINLDSLKKMAKKVNKGLRENVNEYVISDKKSIYVLAEGRLINLSAAEGHPASVMDMSFATQALSCEYVVKNSDKLNKAVHNVPASIEIKIARLKLKALGVSIDKLSPEQKKYLASWKIGT
ncbi:adenosylhomocysteinase [Patescibacteria group bacterium]|nr:adenosylhomocysteinase [Patescibacteria group bacterium]